MAAKQNFGWSPACFVLGDRRDGRYRNSRVVEEAAPPGYQPGQRAGDSSGTQTHEDNALSHV